MRSVARTRSCVQQANLEPVELGEGERRQQGGLCSPSAVATRYARYGPKRDTPCLGVS